MRKSKKSSLNLSVEAIIILILAITMLGLGLGFIKGMFGKVSKGFEEKLGSEPEPPLPTGSEPIMLSRDSINTYPKTEEVIKISVYNPTNQQWVVAPKTSSLLEMDCVTNWGTYTGSYKSQICTGTGPSITACTFTGGNCNKPTGGAQKCPYFATGTWSNLTSGGVPDNQAEIICQSVDGCNYKKGTGNKVGTCDKSSTGLQLNCDASWFTTDTYSNNGATINSGDTKTFSVLFTIPKTAIPGITLCQIDLNGYTKDFTLKIKG